ncbi:MAG: hypothetical protein RI554_04870 [Trueperaceae bacterium]|nr:hypothetical protein [Trueperaceae bacterium]
MTGEPSDASVPADLRGHLPSRTARARADAAGLDLDRLKRERPDEYRILNAEELVRVSPELADAAADLAWRVADGARIFRVPGTPAERLLAFPPLDAAALAAFDDAAADLVARPDVDDLAYYRTVRDPHGERRELMRPIPPDAWAGEVALVGPFADEEAAKAWPAGRLPADLMADPLPYRGRWYCDVFDAEEAWLEARASGEDGG